jgi:adenine deaminase
VDSKQWGLVTKQLVDVSMGRAKADIVIRDGRWVCVQSGEIIDHTDIAISGERIAYVGPDAAHTIGAQTRVIQAEGRYLVPGLLDGHMHVESTMLTVTEFVRSVLPRGTTGIFIDPHEIANVLGLSGVRLMVDEAAEQPIHVWVQMPSCVPAAPGLEKPGAEFGPEEVADAMQWPGVIGLGEVMNFPGVFLNDEKMHAEMAETRHAGKVIGGHYPSLDLGLPFHGYAAGGPEDDHEGTRLEDAVARVRQGMKIMMRLGSAWHDVSTQIKAVTELGLDPRHFILVTDDSHSQTILEDGHMDRVVRFAIQQGASPMIAIQMATLNTAEHFGVARDVGQIAPGRYADILLIPELAEMQMDAVIARGDLAAENGRLTIEIGSYPYPSEVKSTVKLGHVLTAQDFEIATDLEGDVLVNVIGVIENQAPTRHLKMTAQARDGNLSVDLAQDLLKVALVERHRASGDVTVGFVSGFGFDTQCAVASTVAHDSHHMIVVGSNEEDMALAANELARVGGGQIVVKEGEVIGLVELPIAGLMSDEPAVQVAAKAKHLLQGFKDCGCLLNNANMQVSLLALVVIPEIRISDLGLVDVTKFEFIPVVHSD